MLQPKKVIGKKITTTKKSGNPNDDYKNMKDSSGKKGTMGGEGTNPSGPKVNRIAPTNGGARNGKTVKKAKSGKSIKTCRGGCK